MQRQRKTLPLLRYFNLSLKINITTASLRELPLLNWGPLNPFSYLFELEGEGGTHAGAFTKINIEGEPPMEGQTTEIPCNLAAYTTLYYGGAIWASSANTVYLPVPAKQRSPQRYDKIRHPAMQ